MNVTSTFMSLTALLLTPLMVVSQSALRGGPDAEVRTILVGPFRLATLLENDQPKGEFMKYVVVGANLDKRHLQSALNETTVFIVDESIKKEGKWVFTKKEPTVLVGGPLAFRVKKNEKKGDPFEIRLRNVRFSDVNTVNYGERWGCIYIQLDTGEYSFGIGSSITATASSILACSGKIEWSADGTHRFPVD